MSTSVLEDTVRDFVAEWFLRNSQKAKALETLDYEANFVTTGVIDSMDFVRLLMDAESRFGLELDFSELDPSQFLSIDGFAKCVADVAQNA